MKIVITIALLFSFLISNAQIDMTLELSQKLSNKTKFSDIKNTVLEHYNSKLNVLQNKDSTVRKLIMRQLKMWNRQFWLSEYYTDGNGIVQDKNKVDGEALKNLQNNTSTNNALARQNINWINQGPFYSDNGIGRIDKIAFHPTNPNIMYAGSPYGGLYKSLDGGTSWYNTSPNLPSLGISGIAIDPINPQIVYVLTGDANSSDLGIVNSYFYRSNSAGVFKSYDGGNNWERTGFLAPTFVNYRGMDLVINPSNPNILIAATTNGIYRTTNGGQIWDYISSINVFEIKFKPGDANTVYASGSSFYKSTDAGASFSFIPVPVSVGANRISIGVTTANPNRVVLLAGPKLTDLSFNGIFTSNNSGNSFSLLTQSPNVFSNTIGLVSYTDQSGYDNCIAISPTNENDIYVGGLCVWRSTNGGSSWGQASAYRPSDNPYMHPDIHELKFNPLNNNLFCGNDGGVYYYNGSTWDRKYTGITATQFFHFERENDEGDIWGGAQDNGIQEQNGAAAYFEYKGGDGYDVMTDNEYMVADGDGDDVYMSINASIKKDFAGTITDINVPSNTQFFANLAMSPVLEDKIYAGYQNGIWRSFDAGSNWGNIGASANWCISTCRNDDNRIYAAGDGIANVRLYRYDLNLSTLTNITPPSPYVNTLKITDIDVNPTNSNDVWISVAGTTANAKVFATGNGGANWTNISFNLPNVPIFCIKRDASNGLYVGTSIGVFYKRNSNSYWEPFSNGLPPTPVTEIELWPEPNPVGGIVPAYAPSTPEVWVSTFGRGIWYTQQFSNTCDATLSLSGAVTGTLVKEATGVINSQQNLQGGAGTNVKYNAGNYILLTDGFFAPLHTKFQTFTTGCGNIIDLNRTVNANNNDSNSNKKLLQVEK
jgi:photosystem II stability/assembly factor-like uncharacterized protein